MPDLSDLSIERTECPRCGAVWFNGQLFWATGAKGKEEDLAGLVCNMVNTPQCINPKKVQKAVTPGSVVSLWEAMDEKIKTAINLVGMRVCLLGTVNGSGE